MTPEEKAIGSLALVGEGMSVTASDLVDNRFVAVTLGFALCMILLTRRFV